MKAVAFCTCCLVAILTANPCRASVTWDGAVYPYPIESSLSDNLIVGYNTIGSIQITDGSLVQDYYGYLGYYPKATGYAVVDGPGSLWENGRNFYVGYHGDGDLIIKNGGRVETEFTVLSQYAGSVSNVTVQGTGSHLNSRGTLNIGYTGTGTMNLQDGGSAEALTIYLAKNTGSVAHLLVEDADLVARNSIVFSGHYGTGQQARLTIRNRGRVQSVSGAFSANTNGTAHALIDGAGSSWILSGSLQVGSSELGQNKLQVTNGGYLQTITSSRIGGSGISNVVELSGSGTRWQAGSISIAGTGESMMDISDGAQVTANHGYVTGYADQTGTVRVRGVDSLWALNRDLVLGVREGAVGELVVSDGGRITVAEDFTMNAASSIDLGLGTSPWTTPVAVLGRSTLAGTLNLFVSEGASVQADQSFAILQTQLLTGTFAGLGEGAVVDVIDGVAFQITYTGGDGNDVWLNSSQALAGDLNGSGIIDQQDAELVDSNLGTQVVAGHWMQGDADGNGIVNERDLMVVYENWSGPDTPSATVPEPSLALMLTLGALALTHRSKGFDLGATNSS